MPYKLRAEGHSGYASYGNDVVCAAVSVLMQAFYIGLVDIIGLKKISSHIDKSRALIEIDWSNIDIKNLTSEEKYAMQVLIKTFAKSLEETANSYGSFVKYLEVSL